MQCPVCKIEAAIAGFKYSVENDDTAEKETKVYIEQDIKCRNPKCTEFNKIFTTVKNELPVSKD